jgi:hypothetical protein
MHLKSSNERSSAAGLSFLNFALMLRFFSRLTVFLGVVTVVVVVLAVDVFFLVVGGVLRVLFVVLVVVVVVGLLLLLTVVVPPVVLAVLLLSDICLRMFVTTVETSGMVGLPLKIPNTINKSNEIIPRSKNIKL